MVDNPKQLIMSEVRLRQEPYKQLTPFGLTPPATMLADAIQ
jgi:hypothetical protein